MSRPLQKVQPIHCFGTIPDMQVLNACQLVTSNRLIKSSALGDLDWPVRKSTQPTPNASYHHILLAPWVRIASGLMYLFLARCQSGKYMPTTVAHVVLPESTSTFFKRLGPLMLGMKYQHLVPREEGPWHTGCIPFRYYSSLPGSSRY